MEPGIRLPITPVTGGSHDKCDRCRRLDHICYIKSWAPGNLSISTSVADINRIWGTELLSDSLFSQISGASMATNICIFYSLVISLVL